MSKRGTGEALRGLPQRTITDITTLKAVVAHLIDMGEVVIDVETRSTLSGHEYLEPFMQRDVELHLSKLKVVNDEARRRTRERVERDYKEILALDPLRNDVFWIGLACQGRSWVIPMGHPRGRTIRPEEIGDGSTVPPPGFRKILSSGKESLARARYVIPAEYQAAPQQLSKTEVFEALKPLLFNPDVVKVGHNIKFDIRSISKYYGGEIPPGPYVDTMILQHVLEENLLDYSLQALLKFNFDFDPYEKSGKLGKKVAEVGFEEAARYVHLDVRWTWLLYRRLWRGLRRYEPDLLDTFERDMEVLRVLMGMENEGIHIDTQAMQQLAVELDATLKNLRRDIDRHAFRGFNPDSTPDKVRLLFGAKSDGGLGLKPKKRSKKTNVPSVDAEVLEALSTKHPVIPLLQQWAEVKKIKGTYVDGLLSRLYRGRLHPNFKLHGTKTGRLSCSEPNLQNIPRPTEDPLGLGTLIRGLFIAPPGFKLVVFDYSQIEMRVIAIFSRDKRLVRIFLDDEDIHKAVYAGVVGKKIDNVSHDERQIGKTAGFAIGFGAGPEKVAQVAGSTVQQAADFIDGFYETYRGVTEWKRSALQTGRKQGYVETMSGRRRRLDHLTHPSNELRSRAERQAINAIIQGSAADICKDAMIEVAEAFEGTPMRLLLQVHDELVSLVPDDWVEKALEIIPDCMGNGTILRGVPIKASGKAAMRWSEAK